MILENHLHVPAEPDAVFTLINDVERVAVCLPGAVLDGQEDGVYLGRVKFKVGPISADYSGQVRFTEVATDERRLRLLARGADRHGNGDAEADVTLTVSKAPSGSTLELHTDLAVRGKIAQFGKSAINSVSNRMLDQFARNLVAQLQGQSDAPTEGTKPASGAPATNGAGPAPQPVTATAKAANNGEAMDGLAMLLPPEAKRFAALGLAATFGLFQGWLLGRVRTQDKLIKELQRARR